MDPDNTLQSSGASLVTLAGSEAPGEPDELARGTAIGRYLLLGKLGAGGMGVVYVAHDPELDRKVALAAGAARRRRIRRGRASEQALAKVSHPNIVQIYEVGEEDGQIYLAMELVDGDTLRVWQDQAPRSWREILTRWIEVGRGLAAAHKAGLIHRDLKPQSRFPC